MRQYSSRSKHLDFIILDLFGVELSFVLANLARFGIGAAVDYRIFATMNLLLVLLHLVIVFAAESYSGILRRGYLKELKQVVFHNGAVLASGLLVIFFLQASAQYSRLVMVYFFIFDVIIMYLLRIARKRFLLRVSKRHRDGRKMLLVAYRADAEALVKELAEYNYSDFNLEGICILDSNCVGERIEEVEVVTTRKELFEYVKENVVDTVFLKCREDERKKLMDTLYHMGVMVHMSLDFVLGDLPNATLQNINGISVITAAMHQPTTRQRVMKRAMDICGGLVGLCCTGLICLVFGPIIKIQSPGPIFFKQQRVGQNGRRFNIYKFRSMYPDAEARKAELMKENKMSGHMFKMDNDPRIIPIGHFMRKASLDEFPQFLNVLMGDMSLVGTRPPTVDEYEKYELHHRSRLAIKPGLTGLWQVSGRSDITDFEEVVELDKKYIRGFCISQDIKIILKTVWIVLVGRGAS